MKYEISLLQAGKVEKIKAEKVHVLEGFSFIVHKSVFPFLEKWTVSEISTGMMVKEGVTKKEAIKRTKDVLSKFKKIDLQKIIDKRIIENLESYLKAALMEVK